MYMWDESIAMRGSEAIGSSLIHYIKNFVPDTTSYIILNSARPSGQNFNLKIAVFLKLILLQFKHLQTI